MPNEGAVCSAEENDYPGDTKKIHGDVAVIPECMLVPEKSISPCRTLRLRVLLLTETQTVTYLTHFIQDKTNAMGKFSGRRPFTSNREIVTVKETN